jgi:hypothetical protein
LYKIPQQDLSSKVVGDIKETERNIAGQFVGKRHSKMKTKFSPEDEAELGQAKEKLQQAKEKMQQANQNKETSGPKIWQDLGVRSERLLIKDPMFTNLLKKIQAQTELTDRNLIISVLVKLWRLGVLARPKPEKDTSITPGKKSLSSGPNRPMVPGRRDMFEESKRWQKLAGILRD